MTLAARCSACGTVFRVVQDQLRVSEGWVRCGRCAEVFNAIDSLVDFDANARSSQRDTGRERVLDELARVSRSTTSGRAGAVAQPVVPPPSSAAEAVVPSATSVIDIDLDATEINALRATPALHNAPKPAPEFVRRAEAAARWRQPRVRWVLAALAVVSALALGAQVAIEYRDQWVVRWPVTRDFVETLCVVAGCRIEAPRSIESLTVESSGLVRIDATSTYRLSLVLRNRSAHAVAVPAVDLTLTDSQGAAVARRVVRLSEFGSGATSIAGGAELPLQATLTSAERLLNGYTIEVFYP